jgi:hypothetical protein
VQREALLRFMRRHPPFYVVRTLEYLFERRNPRFEHRVGELIEPLKVGAIGHPRLPENHFACHSFPLELTVHPFAWFDAVSYRP